MLPLDGVNILDLSGPPGVWCSGVLASFGAEVIMIQAPEIRFEVRLASGPVEEARTEIDELRSAAYNAFNRNKKSIALNLKSEGQEKFFIS